MDIAGVYRSLFQKKEKREIVAEYFIRSDVIEKGNNLSVAKYKEVQRFLESHFEPDWKTNHQFELYTRLKSIMDNTAERNPTAKKW